MSAVVEAVKGVVDFAGDVIEGVLDDPLTAIATAAAASFGMPFLGLKAGAMAAGVANTAAGLVQGEEFDEALKGGVMAGVSTWGVNQVFGSPAASTVDEAATAGAAKTSDRIATEALKAADDSALSSGYTGGTAAPSFSASNISGSAADDAVTAGLKEAVDPENIFVTQKGLNPGQQNYLRSSTAGGNTMPSQTYTGGSGSYAGGNLAKDAAGELVEGAGTVTHGSSYTGTQNYANVLDDAGNVVRTDVKGGFDVIKNTGGQNIAQNPYPHISDKFNPLHTDISSGTTGWNLKDALIREGDEYLDYIANSGTKALDFAKTYPGATTAGVVGTGLAVDYLMDKAKEGEEEEQRLTEEQKRMQEQMAEAEKTYYQPLPQYTLKRKLYIPEVSQEELYRYGESPEGEYRFYSDSIYEPYTGYQEGGSVMPQAPSKVNPAFAFYKYGNVPNSVRRYEDGGYAEGGSRGDGRSDHIEALLSPGEFVMDAETVALLGNGSSEAGARRLEEMRKAIRKQKGGALSKGEFSPDAKSPLAYLSKKR